ncbi:hypothetical protein HRR83_000132 [Exophiala dermatitidis]|uniref:Uncharacterized protein n=2 Tax=Exophiala dermatitidis TaxID=5970 RepID=H6C8E5_EXODN|nr:uncharacterized protein HMPREF1120_08337 [Exophiala dermatitidis NIH/UT8656]KAJ4523486.1 hypothetical protein HRR73_002668 [Exophiala dermatitidis]EHY60372.1 hypothetical protein HMPREF1120_08337 [Exophiala dermatitidis NIH/UT8656]KAJ4524528.1 hypothetical protein HRR75_000117 [Exophiala dermatitidis]KAJ4527380.1 hypothetical protein HRR74_000133 [Exophiala dermatitidis]KAJ4530942.1 hypothetical protein HRR76_008630 [Exophiala dermatitidis]
MANDNDTNTNKNPLKEAAKSNPTALGDPVSLKAEISNSSPTKGDRPGETTGSDKNQNKQNQTQNSSEKKSLKDVAEQDLDQAKKGNRNRSMLGDPVSLKAEKSDGEDPVKDDEMGGVTGNKGRDSKL